MGPIIIEMVIKGSEEVELQFLSGLLTILKGPDWHEG